MNNDVDRYVIITELPDTILNKHIRAAFVNSNAQNLTMADGRHAVV
jgi:hypothetical protein